MLRKISRSLKFSKKRSVKMALILSSAINISKKSTRYFNNMTFEKFKNDLIKDKKACLIRNNSNNYRR